MLRPVHLISGIDLLDNLANTNIDYLTLYGP